MNDISYEKFDETLNDISYEKLEKLPPSAKLVFKTLEAKGQMTQKDIIRETILPSRTVRYAINRLKEEKILMERFYFLDSRQSLYDIKRPVNQSLAF
ncbi:MAG TPA: helix-turn-helix domain-containing protein [Methanosarcina sp.]